MSDERRVVVRLFGPAREAAGSASVELALSAPATAADAIAPGPVMLPEDFGAAAAERIRKATLLDRLGSPDDVAQSVVYLVAMTDFVTGHVLVVDGGRLIA